MRLSRLLPLLAAPLAASSIALTAYLLLTTWQGEIHAGQAAQKVEQLRRALAAAEMVSRERGPTNGLLGEGLPARAESIQALAAARVRTDRAWAALAQQLPDLADSPMRADSIERLDSARTALQAARSQVDRTAARPREQRTPEAIGAAVRDMVALVPRLAPLVSLLANDAQQSLPELGDDVQGARLTGELREYAGLLGSQFTAALTRRGRFSADERLAIERTRGRIDELRFLLELRVQQPGHTAEVLRAWDQVQEHYFGAAARLVQRVIAAGETDGDFGLDPAHFAEQYVPEMNVMFGLRDALLQHAAMQAEAERDRARRLIALVTAASLALLAGVAVAIALVNRRVLRPLAGTAEALHALAQNDLDAPLPPPQADDEIAAVIGAVHTLRHQTQRREELEQERDDLIERLREQSNSDFLTGLPNRRAFYVAAERELARARRHGYAVTAMLFDIDNFKSFNDRLGHAAGDRALTDVAQVVRREMRAGDLVARYGGEEFVLLLSHCDRERGLQFAERLRAAVAATPIATTTEAAVHCTVSIGVTDSNHHGLALEVLLSKADSAMYRAKQGGRNRVEFAAPNAAAPASDEATSN